MRMVIKVGTSTLAHRSGRLNIRHIEQICKVISDLKNAGNEVVIVSSGAIGMGVGKLGLDSRPQDMPTKQAAAAVGQCELMYTYDKLFSEYDHTVAQILITGEDIENEIRLKHFKDTVFRLLDLDAIPVINENDTVSTEEIKVGDNDTLSAIVAVNINADVLILLSDIDGLYTDDPRADSNAKLIETVMDLDTVNAIVGGAGTSLGTGGMFTKIRAAKICVDKGIDMIIINGSYPDRLYGINENKIIGTKFIGRK